MMIRNGLKAFAGNFILVWKQLLFLAVIILLSAGLLVLSSVPIVEMLKSSGWVAELSSFVELFYTKPSQIATAFESLTANLYSVLVNNFSAVWGNYALSLFLILFLPAFLFHIGEYVLGELMHNRMTSLLNQSYCHKLVSTLGRSTIYSLWKMLCSIPFLIILVGLCFGYGILANAINFAWILLPIFIGLVLLVLAFKNVFFIGFLPEAVATGGNIIKNFANGIDLYSVGFMKKLVLTWGLFIMELAGVLFVSIFTIGVGLPIAIASLLVINTACSFVNFYAIKKENFYVGENMIVKPL